MRKTFSVLDQYGGVIQKFTGTRIDLSSIGMVKLFDTDMDFKEETGYSGDYLKAIHVILPGHTICHTEEYHIGQQAT